MPTARPEPQGRCCARRWGCGGARRSRSSLDSDVAAAEADRLAELRLVAVEDRLEADLRLGRHRELVAELEGLVRDHPLRERLWAQLLLALVPLWSAGRCAVGLPAGPVDPGRGARHRPGGGAAPAARGDPGPGSRAGPAGVGRGRPGPGAPGGAGAGRPGVCRPGGRAGLAAGRLDTGGPWPGRGGALWPARRAWARPGSPQRSPRRSTTRAGGCCTAAAPRQRPTRCSRSRTRSRALGASPPDLHAPGAGQSLAASGEALADLLAGRSDRAVLLVLG